MTPADPPFLPGRVRGLKRGITSLFVLALLALPAAASAAAPENDDFANRRVLSSGFPSGEPVEATSSNVEATKESGEFIPGMSPAGHSVWFEWEAVSDGWVSIGACDNEFPTVLAVFTGTELEHLTPVASGNGSEGPDCPYQGRQYTFFALSGTEYVIAVDGNNFSFPGAPPPVTEGEIALEIEETPVPPNDEFARATTIVGQISEEPGGHRLFSARARGYNWTAGIEPGEPQELTSGASVWYSLTAPENATYRFDPPCCQAALSLDRDLYSGDAVDELTPVPLGEVGPEVDLTAGETVRIRISGPISAGFGETLVASFDFTVMADLAPLDSPPPSPPLSGGGSLPVPLPVSPPPEDRVPPATTIARTVLKRVPPIFVFRFGSNEPGSTFRCSLDRGKFKPCGSSRRFGRPLPGSHKLRVVAVDRAGNADATPAVGRFTFPRPQGRGTRALNG